MLQLQSHLLILLLSCCISGGQANRVYVHPFYLFADKNVICETLQSQTVKPLETVPVAPLDLEVLTPDSKDSAEVDAQKHNITQRAAALAELLNSLGLRMYQALSSRENSTNTLLSPVNTYGSLITFYLGASRRTASSYQFFLGLSSGTDGDDCVSLVDGHKVLRTLQGINSLVDNGPKDKITTQVWAFVRKEAQLSGDFIQGMQDFSDVSFSRGVDFSKQEEAEMTVNSFLDKTSDGKVKNIFTDVNPSSNFLFISSFSFKGNWMTVFEPERISLQEFHVDETTVMTPMMTHTGQYRYLNDKVWRCTVVELTLSKQAFMLLVLPHEGVNLHDIESELLTSVMYGWQKNLQEGLLELSLPKFSMSYETDLHDLLTMINPDVEAKLLGSQADFSQLSNIKPFTVDKAINKVLFEMSEDAAEPQDKKEEAGIPLRLSINRPFFFSVMERDYNSILMLGKITNPTL